MRKHVKSGPAHASWNGYDDVGEIIELQALYDDTLKKCDTFTEFAVMVGQQIARTIDPNATVEWGKWGARLSPENNQHLEHEQLEHLARKIIEHPSWTGLCLATHVFTYGEDATEDR